MSNPSVDVQAQLALSVHALHLVKFVQGEEPPPLIEDEADAKQIFTGIVHLRDLCKSQRDLINHYRAWEEAARARLAILDALLNHSPALEKWRLSVLQDRRQPTLSRVAGWELTAVTCAARGDDEHAKAAHDTARSLASASASASTRRIPTLVSTVASTEGAWHQPAL